MVKRPLKCPHGKTEVVKYPLKRPAAAELLLCNVLFRTECDRCHFRSPAAAYQQRFNTFKRSFVEENLFQRCFLEDSLQG